MAELRCSGGQNRKSLEAHIVIGCGWWQRTGILSGAIHYREAGLLATYLVVTMLIGRLPGSRNRTSNDFLNASRSLPTWVVTLSFLAINCGALEVVGLSGVAAHYGVQAFHFYWIGSIPALIVVGFILLPIYVRSGIRSVPEYLGLRFGYRVRLLNAALLLVSTALLSGISLYGLGQVLHVLLGWTFATGVACFAVVVLAYICAGGIRATIWNEVLQFVLVFVGLLPLLHFARNSRPDQGWLDSSRWHLWKMTPLISHSSSVDGIGVVIGLGLIISFSYWCTDFALMQRALAARTLESARRVPLFAGFGKLLFSFLVVFPVVMLSHGLSTTRQGGLDATSPSLIVTLYGPALICIGAAGLIAGLLAGFASNVSSFSALWTQEIYRTFFRNGRSEAHYIAVSRAANVVCIALSIAGAFATTRFESLSQFVLLVYSILTVPFFAVVLFGVLSSRGSSRSALMGVSAGIATGCLAQLAYAWSWIAAGSVLNANFYVAILSFSVTLLFLTLSPGAGSLHNEAWTHGLILTRVSMAETKPSFILWMLGGILLLACILLNVLWY
jgi:SSS family solute:Na+ symporter